VSRRLFVVQAALAFSLVASALVASAARGSDLFESAFLPFEVGTQAWAAVRADLNNDGHLDLAVANHGANTISVLLGNGDATFAPRVDWPTGTGPACVALGDLNGDGYVDLVVGLYEAMGVGVRLGLGGGSFGPETVYSLGTGVLDIELGDMDGDGPLDVVVAGAVKVIHGQGDGSLGAVHDTSISGRSVTIADLNGDSRRDLVVANDGTNAVTVLLGTGGGAFAAPVDYAPGDGPDEATVGDMNGDGHPDLLAVGYGVSIFLGAGNGTFGTATRYGSFTVQTVVTADLNGDGKLDVAVGPLESGTVVFLGNGNGSLAPANALFTGGDPVAAGDFNADGKQDIVGLSGSNLLGILRGNGDGTFGTARTFGTPSATGAPAIADLNGDGNADVVAVGPNSVYRWLGDGHGGLGSRWQYAACCDPSQLVFADFNADMRPDLAVTSYANNAVSILLGNGGDGFDFPMTFASGAGPSAVASADFNRDGRPDLVVANTLTNTFSVLMGLGDGTFSSNVDYVAAGSISQIATGDLNADSNIDVVVTCSGQNVAGVFLGSSNGVFSFFQNYFAGSSPRGIRLADLNSDTNLDLVMTNLSSNTVSFLAGSGNGQFGVRTTFATGGGPWSLAIDDVDSDGRSDLVTSNGGTISVLRGNGNGTFALHIDYGVPSVLNSFALGRLDNNSSPDLVAGSPNQCLSVMLNSSTPSMISGHVRTSGGTGIASVVMTGLPGNPATGADGFYSVQLSPGFTGTVTPSKAGYVFTPPMTAYAGVPTDLVQDYTAALQVYSISGVVRAGGVGLIGAAMNGLPGNPSTDPNGLYSASVPAGWSGTVTPTKAGYTFTPVSSSYASLSASVVQDYNAPLAGHTITGHVRTPGGAGIASVAMTGLPGNPSTDVNGFYSAVVEFAWFGTVTPTKSGFTFDPPSAAYSNVMTDQVTDYTGSDQTFVVWGFVRDTTGAGIGGVTLTGLPGAPVTAETGIYFGFVGGGWSGIVVPTKSGYAFSPPSVTYATVMISTQTDYQGTLVPPSATGLAPGVTALGTAVPNPFRGRMILPFGLAHPGIATLCVYSVDGRKLRTLASGVRSAGFQSVEWDGRDDGGNDLGPGIYCTRLTTEDGAFTRKVVRVR